MDDIRRALRETFGYDAFREGQEPLIGALTDGRDVLGIMPTGAGKSICYQLPALLMPGLTVVVSPLISLMKDQVDQLSKLGLPAALLNSSLSRLEQEDTLYAMRAGKLKLLYIAPERLDNEGFLEDIMGLDVSLVAVDEAHCVSQWGHDFRPSYVRIKDMIGAFEAANRPRPVMGAFTATATGRVRDDILQLLGLREPLEVNTGYDRPNLHYRVHASDKNAFLLEYIQQNPGVPGIVYCLTRKQAETTAELLRGHSINALAYHAGMSDAERKSSQEAFLYDRIDVIVATNAFGMGIDKSNVRYVIHMGMPKTLESYYQEAGRAGRDGERADCILLYSTQDIVTNRFLIENSGDTSSTGDKTHELALLRDMIDYCHTDECLRAYILRYFGETDVPNTCTACENCTSDTERTDITVEAQKILSCVKRMGERYGTVMVVRVLRGSKDKRLLEFGLDSLSTYGIMRDYDGKTVRALMDWLVAQDYLAISEGEYPVVSVSERGMQFLRERGTLTMKRALPKRKSLREERGAAAEHPELFTRLREERARLAGEQNVPPYVVFSDASLTDMCRRLPRSEEAFLGCSGVGRHKLGLYGQAFLRVIFAFMDENRLNSPEPGTLPAPIPPKPQKDAKKETWLPTYNLYEQGLSIDEIAEARGVGTATIENHLLAAHRSGAPLELSRFMKPDWEVQIRAAADKVGTEYLRPIKDELPEDVTYMAIRLVLGK